MYCVRETPMPNGNQMPGTPIGSSSSPPNIEATIVANVMSARIRKGPSRAMRTPMTTKSAIDATRTALVTLDEWITAPIVPVTARIAAEASTLRHGRKDHRFQAIVHAITTGTHITDASHAYVGRLIRSVHATTALLSLLNAMSASAMLAKIRKPLWSPRDLNRNARQMMANMAIGSTTSTM